MAGWAGFSDSELRKMKGSSSDEHGAPTTAASDVSRQAQLNRQRQREKLRLQRQREMQASNAQNDPINQSQRLSSPAPKLSQNTATHSNSNPFYTSDTTAQSKQNCDSVILKPDEKCDKDSVGNGNCEIENKVLDSKSEAEKPVKELNDEQAISREMSNLAKYQQQQKQMEELNKKKREMLAKTIKERSKKAKDEATKLAQIQKELNHLDHLLTVDVSILRNRIEDASREYAEAQKRYDRAEKEFIEAKMDLFHKGDLKEQLTEHLYNIIYQNEVRKSKKLGELTEKLEMELAGMENDSVDVPDMPPLSMFTGVTGVNTLHSPTSPKHVTTKPELKPHSDNEAKDQQHSSDEVTDGKILSGDGSKDIKNTAENIKGKDVTAEAHVNSSHPETQTSANNVQSTPNTDCDTKKPGSADGAAQAAEFTPQTAESTPQEVNVDNNDS